MKQFARKLRHQQTDAESKLWFSLRNRNIANCKFRRQHPIGSYITDFCCVEKRLVVEVDGSQHSDDHRDKIRTSYLNKKGFKVIRFWDHDVLKRTESVLNQILLELDPHPVPLPEGEGELKRNLNILNIPSPFEKGRGLG